MKEVFKRESFQIAAIPCVIGLTALTIAGGALTLLLSLANTFGG